MNKTIGKTERFFGKNRPRRGLPPETLANGGGGGPAGGCGSGERLRVRGAAAGRGSRGGGARRRGWLRLGFLGGAAWASAGSSGRYKKARPGGVLAGYGPRSVRTFF